MCAEHRASAERSPWLRSYPILAVDGQLHFAFHGPDFSLANKRDALPFGRRSRIARQGVSRRKIDSDCEEQQTSGRTCRPPWIFKTVRFHLLAQSRGTCDLNLEGPEPLVR